MSSPPPADDTAEARFARALHITTGQQSPGTPYPPPIVSTSIYALPGSPAGPYQYGRWSNPTWTALEDALGILEAAEVVSFPSGMAAIASVFHATLRAGDRVLLPADGYYTTRILAEKYFATLGVTVDTCATRAVERRALDGYRLVMLETPTNPGLDLADISVVADRAHAVGALVAVDNTMLTPLGQRPLELGADIVVSSDTKTINGHSDVLFGHVAARDAALVAAIRDWRKFAGAVPGAFEAWLVHRGLETLEVRLARMASTSQWLAERFAAHTAVRDVRYPGLSSHPQHALAQRQMAHGGSIIAITFADAERAERFISGCNLLRSATSFGGVHSSAERRARWGDAVPEGFVRLSVGCEPPDELWRDFERSLRAL